MSTKNANEPLQTWEQLQLNKIFTLVSLSSYSASFTLTSMTANPANSGRKHSLNVKLFKQASSDERPLEYISSSASSTSTNLPQINTTAPPSLPIRRKSFKLNAKSNRFRQSPRRSPSELNSRRSHSPQSPKHSQTSYETNDYFDHLSSDESSYHSHSDFASESSDYDYDVSRCRDLFVAYTASR